MWAQGGVVCRPKGVWYVGPRGCGMWAQGGVVCRPKGVWYVGPRGCGT